MPLIEANLRFETRFTRFGFRFVDVKANINKKSRP